MVWGVTVIVKVPLALSPVTKTVSKKKYLQNQVFSHKTRNVDFGSKKDCEMSVVKIIFKIIKLQQFAEQYFQY